MEEFACCIRCACSMRRSALSMLPPKSDVTASVPPMAMKASAMKLAKMRRKTGALSPISPNHIEPITVMPMPAKINPKQPTTIREAVKADLMGAF